MLPTAASAKEERRGFRRSRAAGVVNATAASTGFWAFSLPLTGLVVKGLSLMLPLGPKGPPLLPGRW
eukprot:11896198-Alexandrium_andersonii.AAC.1